MSGTGPDILEGESLLPPLRLDLSLPGLWRNKVVPRRGLSEGALIADLTPLSAGREK